MDASRKKKKAADSVEQKAKPAGIPAGLLLFPLIIAHFKVNDHGDVADKLSLVYRDVFVL